VPRASCRSPRERRTRHGTRPAVWCKRRRLIAAPTAPRRSLRSA
jgi:hypothetical protein